MDLHNDQIFTKKHHDLKTLKSKKVRHKIMTVTFVGTTIIQKFGNSVLINKHKLTLTRTRDMKSNNQMATIK